MELSPIKTQSQDAKETMKQAPSLQVSDNDEVSVDFVKVEKDLVTLGFFNASSKKIRGEKEKAITFTKFVNGKEVKATVRFIPAAKYGLPITADLDKYLALKELIRNAASDRGVITNPTTFTSAELNHLLGKQARSGKAHREVEEFLKRLFHTGIEFEAAEIEGKRKSRASIAVHVLDKLVTYGEILEDGTMADKHHLWWSEWLLEQIKIFQLLPVELLEYRKLKNYIAKSLVPLLQDWLYATQNHGRFEKRYEAICRLLQITEYTHLSEIQRNFCPALDELVRHGYLSRWEIEETADQKSYKIIFFHGPKFFRDQAIRTGQNPRLAQKRKRRARISASSEQGSEEEATPQITTLDLVPPVPDEPIQETQLALTQDQDRLVRKLFLEFKVTIAKAGELATRKFEETRLQLDAYPYRGVAPKNPAGFIIHAIETNYAPPQGYLDTQEQAAAQAAYASRQATIASCTLCREDGYRFIKQNGYSAARQCTHDPEVESKYEVV